jgi:hypothetical protein
MSPRTALDLMTSPGHAPFTRQMALDMSEAVLQSTIIGFASQSLSWLCYHTHDSRRSVPGFPDLVLVHERQQRVIFTELKKENGRQSPPQRVWERVLLAVGPVVRIEYYLWRPSNWLSGEIGQILQRRPA